MSTYRDTFDRCPRCGIALTDARSARGCPQCGGLFVDEAILTEMIREMLPPGPLGRLQLALLQREEDPIGCPSCGEQMAQTGLMGVPIDRCAKHGVWFDRDELGAALHRTGAPGAAAPMVELPVRGRPQPQPPEPAPVREQRALVVAIERPGEPIERLDLRGEIMKIGRAVGSQIRTSDPKVARMHAIIEVAEQVELIDLGASGGTQVNGEQVTRRILQSGDQIQVGDTLLTVTFAG